MAGYDAILSQTASKLIQGSVQEQYSSLRFIKITPGNFLTILYKTQDKNIKEINTVTN